MTQFFVKATPKISVRKYKDFLYPYLEVWHNCRRTRIQLPCKVKAEQWCKAKQRAYISPLLCELDNTNNTILNKEIEAYIARYMDFYNYICDSPITVDEFNKKLKIYMGRPRKQPQQNTETIDVFEIIEDAITNNKSLKEKGARNNYIGKGVKALRAFSASRDVPISNFDMIDADLIYEFREYLGSGAYTNDGKPYAMATLNSIIKYAVSAIKCAPTKYLTVTRAQTIPIPLLPNNSAENNEIALRDKEVLLLWQYQPKSKKDEEIRDMFLLLCLLGQRVGDFSKIGAGIDEIDGIPCLRLVQDKCAHKLNNDIIFPLAIKILNKYTKLPITDIEKKINENIGRIAKEAGICGEEQISIHYQGNNKPTITNVERTSLIHSHTGRRTFVSILTIHGWDYDRIGKYTGQSRKIVALYDKSTTIDRRIFERSPLNERLEVVGDHITQPQLKSLPQTYVSTPQQLKSLPNSIDEAKQVLNYLGAKPNDYIEITDLDELIRLVSSYESFIIRRVFVEGNVALNRIEEIKQVFNENAPIRERQQHLRNLARLWREQNTERNS